MKNKIDDLRNHLFATLEGLLDKDDPMPIDRAKAVCDVGQTLINSAKVEVDYIKARTQMSEQSLVDYRGSGFIPAEERPLLPPGGRRTS